MADEKIIPLEVEPRAPRRLSAAANPSPAGFPKETPEEYHRAMSLRLDTLKGELGNPDEYGTGDPNVRAAVEREVADTERRLGVTPGQPAAAPAAAPAPAAAAPNAPKWSDIENSPKYQALDGEGRKSVRESFWMDVVSPMVPTEELEQARKEFDERANPSMLKTAGKAAKGAYDAVVDTVSRGVLGDGEQKPVAPAEPVAPPGAEDARPAKMTMTRTGQPVLGEPARQLEEPPGTPGKITEAIGDAVGAMKNWFVDNAKRGFRVERDSPPSDPFVAAINPYVKSANADEAKRYADGRVDSERARADFVRNVTAGVKNVPADYKQIIGGLLQAVGEAADTQPELLGGEVPKHGERTRAQELAAIGQDFYQQGERDQQINDAGLKPGFGAQSVTSAVRSVAQMLPALGLSGGNPLAVIGLMSTSTAAQSYSNAREKGFDPGQAAAYALLQGVIEGGTEYLPVKALLARYPTAAGHFYNFMIREVPSELAATALQSGLDKLTVQPDMTFDQFMNAMAVTLASTPLAAGVQVGAARVAARGAPEPVARSEPAPQPAAAPPAEVVPTDPAQLSRLIAGDQPAAPPPPPAAEPAAPGPEDRAIDVQTMRGTEEPVPAAPVAEAPPKNKPIKKGAEAPPPAIPPAEPEPKVRATSGPAPDAQAPAGEAAKPEELPKNNIPAVSPAIEGAAEGLKKIFESPVDEKAHAAATSPHNEIPEPTQPQKEAGNYQKGHVRLAGLEISIENPAGSERSGVNADGKKWTNTLHDHYGYIRGTIGKDKDHVDVFVKEGTQEEMAGGSPVYVIDQKKPGNGHFDEHKVMIGYENEEEARRAYQRNYSKGWDGIRQVTKMDLAEFKLWLEKGDTTKPAGETWKDGEPEVLSLPMMGKGKGWRGVNSGDVELQKFANGKWGFGLSLSTNISGVGHSPQWHGTMYDTREGALEGAITQGLAWSGGPSDDATHPKHLARIHQWLESLKPTAPAGAGQVKEGFTRMYHGEAKEAADDKSGPRWFSSDLKYAEGYAEKSNGVVSYVDIPTDHPLIKPEYQEQSIAIGFHRNVELPMELAAQRRPLKEEAPAKATAAANDDVRALRLSGDEPNKLAAAVSKKLATTGFATITEARAWATTVIGRKVPPGSVLAKEVDEAIERGVMLRARNIIEVDRERGRTDKEIFGALLELYKRQPNLAVRTSTSIRDQAYSTPVPLAFIASRLAGITAQTDTIYEPTAGNGMLLIEAKPSLNVIANELSAERNEGLGELRFEHPRQDASVWIPKLSFEAVIANPPFGYVKDDSGRNREWKVNAEYTTNQIDHAIAMKALSAMRDDGRAVLIVAGIDKLKEGESKAEAYNGRNLRSFYYTLYRDYNVVDHFTVSGDLYSKQGAAWPVDVIVIRGRGKSAMNLPAADVPKVYGSWGELQEKLDARYTDGTGSDRQQGDGATRGDAGSDARPDVGLAAIRERGNSAGGDGEGRRPGDRGSDRGQRPSAGLAAGEGNQRGKPAGKRDVRGSDRPADAGAGGQPDVEKIFDEEFSKLFGDLEKAPKRGATDNPRASVVPGPEEKSPGPADLALSAVREGAAGLEDVAKGLNALFGAKGRVGSGLQFDEETYAKAKPFFTAGVAHFKQAAVDIREMVRQLLGYLREKASMTAEALQRMKPYIVRFIEDVTAGKIQLEKAKKQDKTIGADDATTPAAAPARPKDAETEHQVAYEPGSGVNAIGTLVPVNMKGSVAEALAALKEKVGDLDAYVAKELDYAPSKLGRYFSAEQVDAIALAIEAMKNDAGFIIGDQTGVGKGRVVAAIIRYAQKNGKTPIFVTEKPNLYKDIYRDLVDIGMPDVSPVMTNSGESIPLTDAGEVVLKSKSGAGHNKTLQDLINSGSLGDADVIFTTYSQMQTIKGGQRTVRMDFMETFGRGGVVIFDESHNAGGNAQAEGSQRGGKAEEELNRASFARALARSAASVFYSSGTYAKRPEVMDLYFKTDMSLAVESPAALPAAIRAGGVPLQQVVASMLAKAGQYIRRERSFAGVTYNTQVTKVNREIAERMSFVMRSVAEFDKLKGGAVAALKKDVRKEAKNVTQDGSVGMAGVHSTNFTSIMHNMVDQMLLALKAVPAAEEAIAAAKRGQKPIFTVANTMGSFIEHYVEDHGLKTGDAVDVTFRDLLLRYLERSRDVLIGDAFGKKERRRLSDGELGMMAVQAYESIKKSILESDFSEIPISPIDFLKARVEAAGLTFGEITGRQHLIDYSTSPPIYRLRPGKELSIRGRNQTIVDFNNGKTDVLLLNQAGATGVSLHASEKFKDQRQRHMMIVQPEKNIDTHMQMLGRPHRTGQVIVPEYTQVVADIPAEKRPAAVLAKKMASLNANTTAARGSALTSKETVDFMNEYGDEVTAQLMEDHPDWHRKMGEPLDDNDLGSGLEREDAIRKVTGRIPLLTIKEQEELYDLIESEYLALIDEKERMGENALEAKTLPLDAKVKSTVQVTQGKGGSSPFAAGASAEIVDVKKLGKPYTSAELLEKLRIELEAGPEDMHGELLRSGTQKMTETRETLEQEFKDFLDQELNGLVDQRNREATKVRLDAQHSRLDRILALGAVARPVVLRTRFGTVPAVVTKVEKRGATKNPAALGAWKVTFAVADAVRHITLPASRLYSADRAPATAVETGIIVIDDYNRADFEGKGVMQAFDEAQSVTREDRVIITGNLLAGFGKFRNGRIINYTTNAGEVKQGILMPAKFDIDSALNELPVEFPTGAAAIGFLEAMDGKAVVESVEEKVFRVNKVPGDSHYRISVAAAREKGGNIYLNKDVIAAAGADFVKAGASMRVDFQNKDQAAKTLQAIMHAGYRVHTQAFRQEAKDYLEKQAPIVRSPATTALDESKWLSAEQVQKTVDDLTKGFAHKPDVRIIGRPGEVLSGAAVNDGTPGFTVNQRVYLVRSGLPDAGEVGVTLWHELFHYGARRFMTKEQYISAMDRLYRANAEVRKRADTWLAGDEGQFVQAADGAAYARARGVDEALAALAERLKGKTWEQVVRQAGALDRAVLAVQEWTAGIADRFGASKVADRIRSYKNMDAIQFVSRVFSKLAKDEVAVSGPGSYSDVAFMQRNPAARANLDRDTSLLDKVVSAPFKLAKWDAIANSAWEKIRAVNERVTDASQIYETIRAGVESNYGLDEPYNDRRVEMQVNLQKWARGAVTMLDKLAGLTREESRVAYEWMNERDADHLIAELSEESKRTLREVKELVRSLGEEAVRLGQLSEEVFRRNELAYLHRSYLKHEIEQTIGQRLGNRKAIALWAEQYKGRGLKDWRTQAELNAWAGEPLDPRTMKGRMFHRLELRGRAPESPTGRLEALGGRQALGRLRKVVYWPEGSPIPQQYAGWHNDGLWEVRWNKGGKWGLWRDLTEDERQALGEIDEVRFAVAKTLHLMTHDIEVGRMQLWVAQQYSKERLEPGDIEASASESMAAAFGRNVWVKVPSIDVKGTNTRKYGALAGRYVPGPIWNDVRQHVSLESKPGAVRKLWDDAMRLWKVSKTALSPGVHVNNVMANFFIADFHDLRAKDLVKALRVMIDARFSKTPDQDNADMYRRFEDSGALHGMFKYHELRRETLDPLLNEIRDEALGNEQQSMARILSILSLMNATERAAKKITGAMVEAYGAEDEVFRLAMFIKGTRNGVTDLEAGKMARQAFLDYDINAPWIQALRRTAFPFIAFPYRAIPMLIDTFTRKPWKLVKYVAIAALLDNLAYAMLGLTPEDEDRERKLLPEERAGKIWGMFPKMLRMPWNSKAEFGEAADRAMSGDTAGASAALRKGSTVFLDVRRWYPAGDVFDVGGTHAVIPWSPTALPGGPMALLAELFSNKAAFTGQPITQDTDTAWEMSKKVGLHLYRFAAPNHFMIPGTWSFEGLRGAAGFGEAGKQTDVFGREMSLPQSFGSALGVKLGTYPEDVMRYNLIRKQDAQVREIMGNIYKATGERTRNKISDEQFRTYVKEQMEKVKALQEKTREKLAPAQP